MAGKGNIKDTARIRVDGDLMILIPWMRNDDELGVSFMKKRSAQKNCRVSLMNFERNASDGRRSSRRTIKKLDWRRALSLVSKLLWPPCGKISDLKNRTMPYGDLRYGDMTFKDDKPRQDECCESCHERLLLRAEDRMTAV
jgi:hypothetical protein